MIKTINWGIMGCGLIAEQFAQALSCLNDARLIAVASTNLNRAQDFASKYKIPVFYDNYEDLASHTDVDVIYIANTHNFHKNTALLCLQNNKAVLCEKPLTINAKEAQEVIDMARSKNAFLMEAMWTRFHPSILKLKDLLADEIIGKVHLLKADFGIITAFGDHGRHLNPNLAGGALLDLGIYPITLANIVFGKHPTDIKSTAYIGPTGVDETSAYLFTYNTGEIAILSSAVKLWIPHIASIYGIKGRITIPDFFHSQEILIQLNGKKEEKLKFPFICNGYEYEAQEVMNCLRQGKTESQIMPLNETLKIMQTMDLLREQWGFKYPGE